MEERRNELLALQESISESKNREYFVNGRGVGRRGF